MAVLREKIVHKEKSMYRTVERAVMAALACLLIGYGANNVCGDVFCDNFDDGVLDGWTPVGPYNPWRITTDGMNGFLEAEGPIGDDKLHLLMLNDHSWDGVSIQFKFRLEQHAQNSSAVGVVFRNQNTVIPPATYPGEHYSVHFGHYSGGGSWARINRGNGFNAIGDEFVTWTQLLTNVGLRPYPQWNEAEVLMPAGSSAFSVWLNGGLIVDNIAAAGPVLGAGSVGFYNHYANTHFDDVCIVPEPATLSLLMLGIAALVRRR